MTNYTVLLLNRTHSFNMNFLQYLRVLLSDNDLEMAMSSTIHNRITALERPLECSHLDAYVNNYNYMPNLRPISTAPWFCVGSLFCNKEFMPEFN